MKFECPEIAIHRFTAEDVITTSPGNNSCEYETPTEEL